MGTIADGVWLDANHTRKPVTWHTKGTGWCPPKADILTYYEVTITGTYTDNQLVDRSDINANAKFLYTANLVGLSPVSGKPMDYMINMNNRGITGGTVLGTNLVRVYVTKAVTMKLEGLELNQKTHVVEYGQDSYGNPDRNGKSYDVITKRTEVDVYLNDVKAGTLKVGTDLVVNITKDDILSFGTTYNGQEFDNGKIVYSNGGTTIGRTGVITIK